MACLEGANASDPRGTMSPSGQLEQRAPHDVEADMPHLAGGGSFR